jgi:hypothetical protein
MSRERLAAAYDALAEASAQVAHELRANEPDAARASVPEAGGANAAPPPRSPAPAARPRDDYAVTGPAGSPMLNEEWERTERLPQRKPQESAFTECPAHKQPFQPGRYGPYCSAKGEPDGNWFNDKGYCRVTPKSAGAWLKQHPQGSTAPAPQDVDDIPF